MFRSGYVICISCKYSSQVTIEPKTYGTVTDSLATAQQHTRHTAKKYIAKNCKNALPRFNLFFENILLVQTHGNNTDIGNLIIFSLYLN